MTRAGAEECCACSSNTPGPEARPSVTLADCERLSRQLQRVLEVEGIEFSRLEVSSPGLDRVLKKAADFRRFTGERAAVRLRVPENGRRRFVGVVRAASERESSSRSTARWYRSHS